MQSRCSLEQEIEQILQYVEMLDAVDTSGVEPTYSVIDATARLHEDVLENPTGTTPEELLACSNQKVAGRQIVLPNIMK